MNLNSSSSQIHPTYCVRRIREDNESHITCPTGVGHGTFGVIREAALLSAGIRRFEGPTDGSADPRMKISLYFDEHSESGGVATVGGLRNQSTVRLASPRPVVPRPAAEDAVADSTKCFDFHCFIGHVRRRGL